MNQDEILIDIPIKSLGEFILCPGETVEFFISMTNEPGINSVPGDSVVFRLVLVSDEAFENDPFREPIVARADNDSISNPLDLLMRNLFYKQTNEKDVPITFTISVQADYFINEDSDTPASIRPGNLQWGYRKYGELYSDLL